MATILFVIGSMLAVAADTNSLLSQAEASYLKRDFERAEKQLRQALQLSPQNAMAHIQLARTLAQLGRVPESLEELERALAIEPRRPEYDVAAGELLQELASLRFAELQKLAPDSAEVHELAGRQMEARGNLDGALAEYRSALKKDPGRTGIHFLIGNVLWKQRDPEGALRELSVELERNPSHMLANLRAGQALLASNEPERAIPMLQRAAPNSLEARRDLGKALRQTGRNEEAKRELETVVKARPDDDSAHALLAQVYRALGDAEGTKRELEIHRKILSRKREASEQRIKESVQK